MWQSPEYSYFFIISELQILAGEKVTVKQRLQCISVKQPLINPRRRIRKAQAVLARLLLLRRQYPSERKLEEAKKIIIYYTFYNVRPETLRLKGGLKKQVGYTVSRPICFNKTNHSGWKLKKFRTLFTLTKINEPYSVLGTNRGYRLFYIFCFSPMTTKTTNQ